MSRWHGARWRRGSRCMGANNCVEVAFRADTVGVRDSKVPGGGPVLEFDAEQWRAFVAAVRDGRVGR